MKQLIISSLFVLFLNFSLTQALDIKAENPLNCKSCHREIYDQWQKSRHAFSTPSKNILFAKLYQKSQQDTDGKTKLYCIKCHAPVSNFNNDVDLQQEITNEGVTCDVCHTVKELTKEPEHWPLIFDDGNIKFGPVKNLEVKAHKTAYSDLFEGSKLCKSCHGGMIDIPQMQGCSDLTICDTYGEWGQSQFSNNTSGCQECHPVHSFEGAYSEEMLQKAVDLKVDFKEFGGKINLNIDITNTGAGHLLPTGPPARLIFIKIHAIDNSGKILWSNFTENPASEDPYGVFHIVYAGSEGKVPVLPWVAVKIIKDTRIKPKETRKLIYKFPSSGVKKIETKLYYRLAPSSLLEKLEITDEYLNKPYLMAEVIRTLD
jgi:hypothetical protein